MSTQIFVGESPAKWGISLSLREIHANFPHNIFSQMGYVDERKELQCKYHNSGISNKENLLSVSVRGRQ